MGSSLSRFIRIPKVGRDVSEEIGFVQEILRSQASDAASTDAVKATHENHLVTRKILVQFFKLIFVSSDGIHVAFCVCREKGRTSARSIDAAIPELSAYGNDY
jgi:hypothetical protein